MPNTKRDKYDEVAEHIETMDLWTINAHKELADYLRSAFPLPAEDARELAVRIVGTSVQEFSRKKSIEEYAWKAATEIESFARSRVEPWREALIAYQKYCVCYRVGKIPSMKLCDQVEKANALLSDSPAKEATS